MGRSITAIADKTRLSPPDPKEPFKALNTTFNVERKGQHVWHVQENFGPDGEKLARAQNEVQFAIGSGQRGHSYFTARDGFLFQTPISWYSQKKIWDLSPGFGNTSLRPVVGICLFCHSGGARPVEQTTNRYEEGIFTTAAISCERCHGPAERHIEYQEKAKHVKGQPDYTIVNPRRLEPALREDVCHQCHLSGEARILRRGRGLFDYRPGLPLYEFWSIYEPAPGLHSVQKAVGHVEQFTESKCNIATKGALGCATCHDPHEQLLPEKRVTHYRKKCLACHEEDHPCTLDRSARLHRNKDDSCIACHMGRLNDTDIAHTAVTDHRILRVPAPVEKPDPQRMFQLPRKPLLLFQKDRRGEDVDSDRDLGMALVRASADRSKPFFRALPEAVQLLEKAREKTPKDVPLLLDLAEALFHLQREAEAVKVYLAILEIEPRNTRALGHLGFSYYALGKHEEARAELKKALGEEPWNGQLHLFLALTLVKEKQYAEASAACDKWLELEPGNADTWFMLAHCRRKQGKADEAVAALKKADALRSPRHDEFRAWFSKSVE
jgi:tetratricopeptide (TPR) repeat protein